MGLGLDSEVHYLEVCTSANHCFCSILSLTQNESTHQRPSRGQCAFQLRKGSLHQFHPSPSQQASKNPRRRNRPPRQFRRLIIRLPPQVQGPNYRGEQQPREERTDFECTLDHIQPTQYDVVALESYQTFRELRESGVIPWGFRFQVSLPTPINGTWDMVDFAHRERVEPLYAERLVQDMNRLQDAVPARDLAIHFDVTVEFAYLEHERGRLAEEPHVFKPYFSPVKKGCCGASMGLRRRCGGMSS